MDPQSEVAIVGAGPYGLSIAAYLKEASISFRIFGRPMHSWHVHAPKGMHMKSEGFALNLHAPAPAFPLATYCAEQNIPYADIDMPISVKTFVDYGREFQRRYVPDLDERQVVSLERWENGFRLQLADGECIAVRAVVLATGLGYYAHIPAVLAGLPAEVLSHSWDCGNLDQFAGRQVAVVGAGASAVNTAATLLKAGAAVDLLTRSDTIKFHSPPAAQPRPLWQRLRWPQTDIGSGWKSQFCSTFPQLFHWLPTRLRHRVVRNHLGPASAWFLRDQVAQATVHTAVSVEQAQMREHRVVLHLRRSNGDSEIIEADHVIAATGFDIDLKKLPLLSPALLADLAMEANKPVLSANFESSVPGLYFAGTAAAVSFGPLLRFTCGAGFAARRIARSLAPARTQARPVEYPTDQRLSPMET